MKLPEAHLDLAAELSEFDIWITPSLGEIRDTERFQLELERVVRVFDALANATDDFADRSHCDPERIAQTFCRIVSTMSTSEAAATLSELAAVLFLVTGRSDNNAKCQLPLHLRDRAKWTSIPVPRRASGATSAQNAVIPRELKADKYMTLAAGLSGHPELLKRLVGEYVRFVLADHRDVAQLWSIGRSYCMLRAFGGEKDLLTPMVVFQVRGSVSASGGHGPEDILRRRLDEWGLLRGVDYNTTDVVVQGAAASREKTRAYDFVIPYATPGWGQRLFIQCQFYAGDSGSVSHKNVDQTSASRRAVLHQDESALFLEYLDGAGYFSSLNGDLKKLLAMPSTHSYFQIRSAPVRLRRILQSIGFVTPLEVGHAVLLTDGRRESVVAALIRDGYESDIAASGVWGAVAGGWVNDDGDVLRLTPEVRDVSRRYLMLDVGAAHGGDIVGNRTAAAGCLLVPGYGPFHGMKVDELAKATLALAPSLSSDWGGARVLEDVRWLCEQGYAMSS